MEVIVDTTTLYNFLLIDRLELLSGVVGKICTTEHVIEELKLCTARNVLPAADSQIEILGLTPMKNGFFQSQMKCSVKEKRHVLRFVCHVPLKYLQMIWTQGSSRREQVILYQER